MHKHRIFIVDDEAPARQRLATLLSDIQDTCSCELAGEAGNAQEALDAIMSSRPDIVLLDVQMPGMTGLELARHLTDNMDAAAPAIIFITAYDEYAVKAFDVHALDYLLKPVRAARLEEAILRASRIRAGSRQADAAIATAPERRRNFSVLERGRVLLVPVADVLFLKAEQKYVTLHTRERSYLLEEALVSIEEEMADVLVRVHRNALIARNAIRGVERVSHLAHQGSDKNAPQSMGADGVLEKISESWQVILRDTDERLPVSRRQWPVIKSLVR
ncbi:LytR/AlgR family response regulator transcription factor [Undibacterium sp. TJN25]|uniref:LytR/AlgR family response regulator transcription factor n=1 Tax=Undibacterium sp. TJN25 TaxID=3413056 RepID=UPI003BEFE3F0